MIFTELIGLFWFVFIACWLVAALGAKKSVRGGLWLKGAFGRVIMFLAAIYFLRHAHWHSGMITFASPLLRAFGVFMCAAGIAFAFWARWNIGRNWGAPMSMRIDPELVTTGPYRFVRHPIYTGILLAQLGSALAGGIWWLVVFAISIVYFVCSAIVEEKLMRDRFPGQYTDYQKRTKMLIPWVV
jgi:protein-S-isoprenylcysteine O-methyltransferase Ste14